MTKPEIPGGIFGSKKIASISDSLLTLSEKSHTPWAIFWKNFKKNKFALTGAGILIVLYLSAIFAPFIAPYSMEAQNRTLFYNPPTRIHFVDKEGKFHIRPFVYQYYLSDPGWTKYSEDKRITFPIKLFAKGEEYSFFGIRTSRHLFGVDSDARIFLLGSDQFGRDIFSRLLFGGRISLSVGVIGILVTFAFGLVVGGISGYFGGVVDNLAMRFSEILMSVPGLYLILAIRAAFPASIPSDKMYLIIVFILSFIGWASLGRVIRGMVLSLKANEFVTAAMALGAGNLRIIMRHIIPNTMSFTIVAATVSLPGYILGEVALSFLGVGIQEPQASWGNMLQHAQSVRVLTSFPWVLAPGFFIFITVLAFNFLGDGLRDALDPRKVEGR
ncbi:MAG: ABC transporter permease [Candidatus Eisenbacteria bacterium]|nr:ABC transporter permease [Candidatus Eisenbacteria bacterium]